MTKGGGGVSQKMTIADEGEVGSEIFQIMEFKGAKYVEKKTV